MKNGRTIAVLIALLTTLVLYWVFRLNPTSLPDGGLVEMERVAQEIAVPKLDPDQDSAVDGVEIGTAAKRPQSQSHKDFYLKFLNANNAQDAQVAIDEAYALGMDELARELELDLRLRCGYIDSSFQDETNWALQKIHKYCEGWSGSISDDETPLISGPQTLKQHRLFNSFRELSIEEFEVVAENQIANANSPGDIEAVSGMLSFLRGGGATISLGQVDSPITDVDQIHRYQQEAINMYQCYQFGGCGPDGMRTLEICAITELCQPGWDMTDYIQSTISPIQFDAALQLFEYLKGLENP